MDHIANGSTSDITSWDEMKKDLQTHFNPQDEMWEADEDKVHKVEKEPTDISAEVCECGFGTS